MIQLENVNFSYKTFEKKIGFKECLKDLFNRQVIEKQALIDININIKPGEIVGFLGKNGAGKTTLIKLMCGLIHPKSGEIKINDFNPYKKEKKFLKNLGLVLGQKSQLVWDLPSIDTLCVIKEIYNISDNEYNEYLDYLTELLNVKHLLNIPVRKLSLGERMKFEIICAVIHKPKILFLDEPTIGLDIESQAIIHNFLKKINKELNTTIILTSHYIKDIETLSHRVIIIGNGKVKYNCSINELLEKFNEKRILQVKGENLNLDYIPGAKIESISSSEYNLILNDDVNLNFILNYLSNSKGIIEDIRLKKVPLEDVIFSLYQED